MMTLDAFFNDLAANPSRNYKIQKLEENRDNAGLIHVVRLALDPFTNFYIRKIPEYEYVGADSEHQTSLGMALENLYYLSSREVTGNAAIAHLRAILSGLEPHEAKVIERIIQKDLKCGVSISTANAVWTGLVNDYPVMLCSQFEQKLVDKVQFPAMVQTKMDGMRFNAIVRDGKVEYRSRNGKEIQLLGNLDEDFIKMAGEVDCVFDGELLVNDKGVVLDRQTGNGILNKANKGTISDLEANKVRATVWDVIPYLYFVDGECPVPYGKRMDSLNVLMDTHQPKKVSLVDNWVVENYEEAKTLFEGLLADGQEGIILKDMRGIWENKRAKHQIKFKGELECDLKIVAVEEGQGKAVGMLGAIVCESSDGLLKVNVGSGFNDEHRNNLWHIKRELIGRIVAVKYNMRSKNKAGDESLFLPIFIELRDDKTEADSLGDIK
jgi:ATP-dependent DNA ligase